MAKKLRIYELAKEHKKSTKEMLSLLKDEFGLKIKSHMSVLSGDELAIVEEYFSEDKKIKEEKKEIKEEKKSEEKSLEDKNSKNKKEKKSSKKKRKTKIKSKIKDQKNQPKEK